MARGDAGYEKAKAATKRADAKDQAAQKALRAKHEGSGHAPAKLTRDELKLAARMTDDSGETGVKKSRFRRG